jgi:hypothetical protein
MKLKNGPFVHSEHGAKRPQLLNRSCVSATFAPRMADTRRTAHAHNMLYATYHKMVETVRQAGS